jgi:hypothetical protein
MPTDPLLELEAEILAAARRLALAVAPVALSALAFVRL